MSTGRVSTRVRALRPPRSVSSAARLIARHGYTDFKWMDPREIVVAEWVRMKCRFGCSGWGRNATCPPNVPSVAECRRFFDEYRAAAVFHFSRKVARPLDRKPWTKRITRDLSQLERAVFLAGYQRAFLLPMDSCQYCANCPGVRGECKFPAIARPTPESLAVDVFSTVRKLGYPIEVLTDYTKVMNRYAILLIE